MSDRSVEEILADKFFPRGREGLPAEQLQAVVADCIERTEQAWGIPVHDALTQHADTIEAMHVDALPRDLSERDMGGYLQVQIMNTLEDARDREAGRVPGQQEITSDNGAYWANAVGGPRASARPAAERNAESGPPQLH